MEWIAYSIILLCLVMSAFFSSSETSLFALDEMKIKNLGSREDRKRIRGLLKNTSILLITILFGNTLVNMLVSSLIEQNIHIDNPLITTLIVTATLLVFGEIGPKTLALMHVEPVALFNSRILYYLNFVFKPIAIALNAFVNAIMKLINWLRPRKSNPDIDRDHLPALISIVSREDIFEKDERILVESVLKFAGREVWNIMTPRTKVVSIDQDQPVTGLIELFRKRPLSKIPVYSGTNDNITGVVHLRTVFPYFHNMEKVKNKKVRDLMESMYYVPETKKLSEMLEDFKRKNIRIAAVVDEYGYSLGIVTIADVLGEIVGEIMDESFKVEKRIHKESRGRFIVKGDLSLVDFNNFFKTDLSSNEYETIAGYIIEQTGDIPEKDFVLDIGNYRLSVGQKSDKHIESLVVDKKKRA